MKLKQLESYLQGVQNEFPVPKIALEQYPTSAHLAARMLFTAAQYGDIEDKRVCDLGCGTGMLTSAAEACGAAYVVGMDLDPDALAVARENLRRLGDDLERATASASGSRSMPTT